MTKVREELVLVALLTTRNALVAVGRDCPYRTEALEIADAALADYPPFIAQMQEQDRMVAEAKEKGWME